ncbi:protein lin-52 homolog isoform X4 [Kogia breviceps]|uniref:protein lin-52 homolog isoform X4 n=1 Tax=Kogia breviceps TaxID=27615 RepID=UPI0034D28B34
MGGETRPGRVLGIGFLFGGVAYGSLLSRRRLATSRDMCWKMASPTDGADLEASLLSFEKLDRASPDLWPEQLPGVAEFAASFKSPITSSPPKWMAEIERDDIDMLKGSAGSAAMAHGPSRSVACGIFPDRRTNPCPLHRQVDSQPLCYQGSPSLCFLNLGK